MTRTRTTACAAAAAAVLLTLSGCGDASREGRLAILEAEPSEPVPEYANAMGILEPGSARLLGVADGTEYYVGREAGSRGVICMIPIDEEDPEQIGGAVCSTESTGVVVTMEREHGEAALVADDPGEQVLNDLSEDGWSEVSQNLWTR